MCRPPASSNRTVTSSASRRSVSRGWPHPADLLAPLSSASRLPPSTMSVPRPAMFVAIVTTPGLPACAMISASCSWYLAFSTLCSMPSPSGTPPTAPRTSRPTPCPPALAHRCQCTTARLLLMASNFSSRVRYTRSFMIIAQHGHVGRDHHAVQAVDLSEFKRLRVGGSRHPRQSLS